MDLTFLPKPQTNLTYFSLLFSIPTPHSPISPSHPMARRFLPDDDDPASQHCSPQFPRRPETTVVSTGLKYHMPPYLIFLLCLLAAAFVFLCYVTILKRYRLDLRILRREPPPQGSREVFVDGDRAPPVDHPVWYIRTVGLPASVIESITVFRYKRGEGLTEGSDCSVCLTEFQEDETLRLLPKCSHAFHVSCIDTWLSAHMNCPMCRAPVTAGSDVAVEVQIDGNLTAAGDHETRAEHASSDPENHEAIIRTNHKGIRAQSDLAEHRVSCGRGFQPAARRSASMDSSAVSMISVSGGEIGPSGSSSSGSRSSNWYRAIKSSSFRLPMIRSSSSTSTGNCSLPTTTT